MALLYWLPLVADLRQNGIAGESITNHGAVINAQGKLGRCYEFGPSKWANCSGSAMKTITECSYALWIKPGAFAAYNAYIYATNGSTGWNNYIFALTRPYGDATTKKIGLTISNGSSATNANYVTNTQFELNTWYHLVVTYKAGEIKFYVNGILDATYAPTIVPNFSSINNLVFGAETGGSFTAQTFMNDIRVYDECLSAKQVKLISQGLIIHYPLCGMNTNHPNLFQNSYLYNNQTPFVQSTSRADGYFELRQLYVNGLTAGDTLIYSVECDGNLAQGHNSPQSPANRLCTVWLYWSSNQYTGSNAGYTRTMCLGSNNRAYDIDLGNGWHRWGFRVTVPSDATNCVVRINNYSDGNGVVTIRYRNFQLEKGNEMTAYHVAYPHDQMWEPETAGYSDGPGIWHGNIPTTYTPSPRYHRATHFDGSSWITGLLPFDVGFKNNEFTHSAWCKANYNNNPAGLHTFAAGNGWVRLALGKGVLFWNYWATCATDGSGVVHGQPISYGDKSQIDANKWYFITSTFKNGTVRLYIDGVEVGNSTNNDKPVMLAEQNNYAIGAYTSYGGELGTGEIVDSRVYMTALSADDILELYKTSMEIDSSGNILPRVLST